MFRLLPVGQTGIISLNKDLGLAHRLVQPICIFLLYLMLIYALPVVDQTMYFKVSVMLVFHSGLFVLHLNFVFFATKLAKFVLVL